MSDDVEIKAPRVYSGPGQRATVLTGYNVMHPDRVRVSLVLGEGEYEAVVFYVSADDAEVISAQLTAAAHSVRERERGRGR